MNRRDYQKELDRLIEEHRREGVRPRLLFHLCCAPCGSYCLEYLEPVFDITVFFYNPNITDEAEYLHRLKEVRRLVSFYEGRVGLLVPPYRNAEFFTAARGLEKESEGGARCSVCYELRLERTARAAKEERYDYFASSLSVSPHKNAALLNEIGERLSVCYGVRHLPNDFKKRGGYQRSVALSKEAGFYRQDYCGCVYSRTSRETQSHAKTE